MTKIFKNHVKVYGTANQKNMKRFPFIVLLFTGCFSQKTYTSKIKFVDTANPEISVVVVEQEGKNENDAEKRAIKYAIDNVVQTLISSNSEKYLYEEKKEKVYERWRDFIIRKNVDERKGNSVKITFGILKSKLREYLIELSVLRQNISYSGHSATVLINFSSKGCGENENSFAKGLISRMFSKIGANVIFPGESSSESEELGGIFIREEKIRKCVIYGCDFSAEIKGICGPNRFRINFSLTEPITSYVISEENVAVDFPKELTLYDAIDEAVYRAFHKIIPKYVRYLESIKVFPKIVFVRTKGKKIKNEKFYEFGISVFSVSEKPDGVYLIVLTNLKTEEMSLILPYILEDTMLKIGFLSKKLIVLYPSDE